MNNFGFVSILGTFRQKDCHLVALSKNNHLAFQSRESKATDLHY